MQILYRNNLKNREFDKEASQNSHLERATIVRAQGANEDENFEKKPTPSKTDSLGCFGICIVSVLSLVLFGFIFFSPERKKKACFHDVKNKMACIPQEDQIALSWFFRKLLQEDGAGYVLYGSKPMCYATYRQPKIHFSVESAPLNKRDVLMHMGLSTWKKYASFFPMKHFALIDYPDANGTVTILLINKTTLLQEIEGELREFEHFYSKKINATDILDQIVNRDPIFFEMFHKNEQMMGVLLGYGTNNAKLYARKVELWNGLGKVEHRGITYRVKPKNLTYKAIRPSFGFNSLEDELRFLDKKTKVFDKPPSNFNFTPRVGFVGDNQDPETQQLRKRYRLEQRQIPSLYSKGDFLLTTLAKLVEH